MKRRPAAALLQLALTALLALPAATTRCQVTDCPPRDCACIRSRAFDALQRQDFEGAVTKFAAWKTCDPRRSAEADSMTLVAFRAVDKLRNEAERSNRTIWANDLVAKSRAALRRGDRNAAFRLAEFAWRYADSNNPEVINALMKALYYNDLHDPAHHLPRHCSLQGHAPLKDDAVAIRGVAFSPDGKWLATASDDFTAKIWDLENWKERMTLAGHTHYVRCVAFSPDGRWLATGAADKTVKIWDLENGKERLSLNGHGAAVPCLAFSPDGRWLATGSNDKTAKIWDLESGKERLTIKGHTATVWGIAFSPDGRWLATASDDKTARIWERESGREIMILAGHSAPVRCIAFSPDGRRLATGADDKTAKIWDPETGKELLTIREYASQVWCLAFSPDGKRLATGHNDQLAKIWDAHTGKSLTTLVSHELSVRSIAFSPDGNRLATGGYDNTAKIWDLNGEAELVVLRGHASSVRSLAFSPACTGNPGGQWLATASDDGTANIWDAESGQERITLAGHVYPVRSIAFSPACASGKGLRLATGSDDNTAKIWDAGSGAALFTLPGHASTVRSVAFSPDGQRLATGSDDKTAKIWNAETGKLLTTLSGHTSWVTSVAFSPACSGDPKKQRLLATGSLDGTVKIWNAETGKAFKTLTGHDAWVMCVAFSPSCTGEAGKGQRLATGADDGTIRIWDVETGKALLTLSGHQAAVRSVAFSPDGRWLSTGSDDSHAKIWDMESGNELMELDGHRAGVWGVAFSPDGRRLATGSEDNTAIIWEVDGNALIQRWYKAACTAPIPLLLRDVDMYGIAPLLDVRPDNEAELIDTRETWQIAAFADLVANSATGGNALSAVRTYFDRADRLYRAALEAGPNNFLELKRCKLLLHFAGTSLANAQTEQAYALATQALQLRPDDPDVYAQVLSIISEALSGKEVSAGNYLSSEKRWELQLYGDYFFGKEKWADAGLLYEKTERMEHSCEILIRLHQIAEKTGQPFDFQRFLTSEKTTELRQYAAYFFDLGKWPEAGLLYEKLEPPKHAPETLIRLHQIAEKTGQAFDFQRFIASEQADELKQYAEYFFGTGKFAEAAQLYEKAERLEHAPETLLQLYRIGEAGGPAFDVQRLLAAENAAELRQYAAYFYETGLQLNDDDRQTEGRQLLAFSASLYEKANRVDPAPETLLQLHRIAEVTGQLFDFQRFLRSGNPSELAQYAGYFAGIPKEHYKDRTPPLLQAVQLGEKLLALDTSAAVRTTVAQYYDLLGFSQLCIPDGRAAEASLRRGLALDVSNRRLAKNICHALLLQERYREAEAEYLKWKNKAYGDDDLPLFKDAFLDDLNTLEAQGVRHADLARVREVLEGSGGR